MPAKPDPKTIMPEVTPTPVETPPAIIVPTAKESDVMPVDLQKLLNSFGGPPIVANPTRHDLDTFTKGEWKDSKTGELFMLRIVPNADMERTHQLANNRHYRELTEQDFRLTFEKP